MVEIPERLYFFVQRDLRLLTNKVLRFYFAVLLLYPLLLSLYMLFTGEFANTYQHGHIQFLSLLLDDIFSMPFSSLIPLLMFYALGAVFIYFFIWVELVNDDPYSLNDLCYDKHSPVLVWSTPELVKQCIIPKPVPTIRLYVLIGAAFIVDFLALTFLKWLGSNQAQIFNHIYLIDVSLRFLYKPFLPLIIAPCLIWLLNNYPYAHKLYFREEYRAFLATLRRYKTIDDLIDKSKINLKYDGDVAEIELRLGDVDAGHVLGAINRRMPGIPRLYINVLRYWESGCQELKKYALKEVNEIRQEAEQERARIDDKAEQEWASIDHEYEIVCQIIRTQPKTKCSFCTDGYKLPIGSDKMCLVCSGRGKIYHPPQPRTVKEWCSRCRGRGECLQVTNPAFRSVGVPSQVWGPCPECHGARVRTRIVGYTQGFDVDCSRCGGHGREPLSDSERRCDKCGGTGFAPKVFPPKPTFEKPVFDTFDYCKKRYSELEGRIQEMFFDRAKASLSDIIT